MPTQQQERPPQHQNQQPGHQTEMNPAPMVVDPDYQGSHKLKDKVATFGQQVPMQRVGQPAEVAPCYVFLASKDASYMTGQVLHPNGGEVVNG